MPGLFEKLDGKKAKDLKVLAGFVGIYCRENHGSRGRSELPVRDARLGGVLGGRRPVLCEECRRLLEHGIAKLLLCPYDPKPMCKKCPTHCYAPGYRERIREVMRFSGLYLVKHGRLDLLVHYYF
jgi:hypothetical protein